MISLSRLQKRYAGYVLAGLAAWGVGDKIADGMNASTAHQRISDEISIPLNEKITRWSVINGNYSFNRYWGQYPEFAVKEFRENAPYRQEEKTSNWVNTPSQKINGNYDIITIDSKKALEIGDGTLNMDLVYPAGTIQKIRNGEAFDPAAIVAYGGPKPIGLLGFMPENYLDSLFRNTKHVFQHVALGDAALIKKENANRWGKAFVGLRSP